MAKIAFSKLNLKPQFNEIIPLQINDITVSVKKYLPLEDKIAIIDTVINNCYDEQADFYNNCKIEVLLDLEIIYNYTDISFTAKQKENVYQLYDILNTNGIIEQVKEIIHPDEYEFLYYNIMETINALYKYKDSVYGIMDGLKNNYNNLKFDTESLEQNISNPDNLALLKDILDKLG